MVLITLLSLLLWAPSVLSWTIPQINTPTFTYQCMPMQMQWRDGSPPYSIWFDPAYSLTGTAPRPGYGAWHNITGVNYLVPCVAPAGSSMKLVLQDSTGWISVASADFVVLPSSDSSCLASTLNDAALSQSQGTLSTLLQSFQKSVISAISISATATASAIEITSLHVESSESPVASATPSPVSSETSRGVNLPRILGPVLGCLVVILLGIALSICFIRQRRRKRQQLDPDSHIPLGSTSGVDLLGGEPERHDGPGMQETGNVTVGAGRPASGSPGMVAVATSRPAVGGVMTSRPVVENRLQLHDGSALGQPRSQKEQANTVPAPSEQTRGAGERTRIEDPPQARQPTTEQRNLEQRAEELSAPELERLAALVARRLERVRGAPPQYEATDGVGV